jgi:hypothetical protein
MFKSFLLKLIKSILYGNKVPCEDLVFDVNKESDIYSLSVPKGRSKFNANKEEEDNDQQQSNDEYYDENSYIQYDSNYYDDGHSTTSITTTAEMIRLDNVKSSDGKTSKSLNRVVEYTDNDNQNLVATTTTKVTRNTKLTTQTDKTTMPNSIVNSKNNNDKILNDSVNSSSFSLFNSGSSIYSGRNFIFKNSYLFSYSSFFYYLFYNYLSLMILFNCFVYFSYHY